ncbi:MAG: hypothetical protein V9E87_02245 [Gemmatimonadales bacterium]
MARRRDAIRAANCLQGPTGCAQLGDDVCETAADLLGEYYTKAEQADLAGFNRQVGGEIKERLTQLDYLYSRAMTASDRIAEIGARSHGVLRHYAEQGRRPAVDAAPFAFPPAAQFTPEERQEFEEAVFQAHLYAECFYFIAGRVRQALRNKNPPLPGLETFEAVGARDVRNHLLEHPEGASSRVFSQTFSCGGPMGPVLKSGRWNTEGAFPDSGLVANATQMNEAMVTALRSALNWLKT